MIASINATSLATTAMTPSLQHQQPLLTPVSSTLNDLKLKFEPSNPKVYNSLLKSSHTNSHSLTHQTTHHGHTSFEQTPSISGNSHLTTNSYINSYKNSIGLLQQQSGQHNHHPVQSYSSSSSSSNFSASLSPSSSSSWSANNSSANMAIATSLIK